MADSCSVCGRDPTYCEAHKDTCAPERQGSYYNPKAFYATQKWLSENNPHFLGQDAEIRKRMLAAIAEVAASPNWNCSVSNIGFTIQKVSNCRYIRILIDMNVANHLSDDEEYAYVDDVIPAVSTAIDPEFSGMMGSTTHSMPKRKVER